eukprot:TRINITY_DN155_c0_g1_i1.p1 TRINITY_DN155_c0_g1~~TRINITY_DN155_c0_g1_i1.p1  ORF type:complete len:634 (-),score=318.22 TRINITY_DN155_c0_g1_i1:40-1941(-)
MKNNLLFLNILLLFCFFILNVNCDLENFKNSLEIDSNKFSSSKTDDIAVWFNFSTSINKINEIASKIGYKNLGKIINNVYLFRSFETIILKKQLQEKLESLENLKEFKLIENFIKEKENNNENLKEKILSKLLEYKEFIIKFEQLEKKTRVKRTLNIHDPLYSKQWHLHDSNSVNVEVEPVWDRVTGKGILITIVDDGLFTKHPDFKHKYNSSASYDFNHFDNDPTPYSYDLHGTAAAGAAAAASNEYCGVGVAPDANVASVRLVADAPTDAEEAQGLSYAHTFVDIYSCSWGPVDSGTYMEGPSELTKQAIEQTINYGRNGRGSIYVWASGNGNANGDSCNYDGYVNSRYTISIGAIDYLGKQAWYSEGCASLIGVTPSSSLGRYIVTTGSYLNDVASCYSSFSGTSAACPIAAGILALILEARPELTWRDVQGLIINSAIKTDSNSDSWSINRAGLWHSPKYGFGKITALAAIEKAGSWTLLPEYVQMQTGYTLVNNIIAAGSVAQIRAHIYSTDNDNDNDNNEQENIYNQKQKREKKFIVEHVEFYLRISVIERGNIQIILQSPQGTDSELHAYHSDRNSNINWTYTTIRTWGEEGEGTWLATISLSSQSRLPATLHGYELRIFGHYSDA